MKVGVPREVRPGERRVALVPETVKKLGDLGLEVVVEKGAGAESGFADAEYTEAGATVADSAVVYASDVVVKVAPPAVGAVGAAGDEVGQLKAGAAFIGLLYPLTSPELIRALAAAKATSFSMELVPRITVAQRMDALSSQATVAGYIAVLQGAYEMDSSSPC
jgi:H+-translocating NAD(P) transhydrogenase subunit alpha